MHRALCTTTAATLISLERQVQGWPTRSTSGSCLLLVVPGGVEQVERGGVKQQAEEVGHESV